jgi:hypothetical protein
MSKMVASAEFILMKEGLSHRIVCDICDNY